MKKLLWTGMLIFSLIFTTACGTSPSSSAPAATGATGSGTTAAAAPQTLTKVKVGYDGLSMTAAPLNYTFQKGIFKKYGLDVDVTFISSGTTLAQSTIGGSIDIAENGYSPAAASMVAGSGLIFFGGIINTNTFQLVVKSDIKDGNSLKGKKIAISTLGSATDDAANLALTHFGLKKSDVTILALGDAGQRAAALMSGQIDGAMELYPQTGQLVKQGYKILVNLEDIAGDWPGTAFVANKSYIAKNPETIKKFIMAMSEGVWEFKKNKDEAEKLTAAFLKIDNPKDLDETYDDYVKNVYPDKPVPTIKGIGLLLEQMALINPNAKGVKPEQLVDTTALDALEKEGFFKNIPK